ncbi:hypothetical protein AA313_de0204493 [Arthrobotrys entomopaga]|nr:hypothetical protein AA313_de0204493 [Arthrobotrys entomopaga]
MNILLARSGFLFLLLFLYHKVLVKHVEAHILPRNLRVIANGPGDIQSVDSNENEPKIPRNTALAKSRVYPATPKFLKRAGDGKRKGTDTPEDPGRAPTKRPKTDAFDTAVLAGELFLIEDENFRSLAAQGEPQPPEEPIDPSVFKVGTYRPDNRNYNYPIPAKIDESLFGSDHLPESFIKYKNSFILINVNIEEVNTPGGAQIGLAGYSSVQNSIILINCIVGWFAQGWRIPGVSEFVHGLWSYEFKKNHDSQLNYIYLYNIKNENTIGILNSALGLLNPGRGKDIRHGDPIRLNKHDLKDDIHQNAWKAIIGTAEVSTCFQFLYTYPEDLKNREVTWIRVVGYQGKDKNPTVTISLKLAERAPGPEDVPQLDESSGDAHMATEENTDPVQLEVFRYAVKNGENAERERSRRETEYSKHPTDEDDTKPEPIEWSMVFDVSGTEGQSYSFPSLLRELNSEYRIIRNGPSYRKVHIVENPVDNYAETIFRTSSSRKDKHFAFWWSKKLFEPPAENLNSLLYQSWSIGSMICTTCSTLQIGLEGIDFTPTTDLNYVTIWNIENLLTLTVLREAHRLYSGDASAPVLGDPDSSPEVVKFHLEDFDHEDQAKYDIWNALLGTTEIKAIVEMCGTFVKGMRAAKITSIEYIFHKDVSDSNYHSPIPPASILLTLNSGIDEAESKPSKQDETEEIQTLYPLNVLTLPIHRFQTSNRITVHPIEDAMVQGGVYISSKIPSFTQITVKIFSEDRQFELSISSREQHLVIMEIPDPKLGFNQPQRFDILTDELIPDPTGELLFVSWFSEEGWSRIRHFTFQAIPNRELSKTFIDKYSSNQKANNNNNNNGIYRNDGSEPWSTVLEDFYKTPEGTAVRFFVEKRSWFLSAASINLIQIGAQKVNRLDRLNNFIFVQLGPALIPDENDLQFELDENSNDLQFELASDSGEATNIPHLPEMFRGYTVYGSDDPRTLPEVVHRLYSEGVNERSFFLKLYQKQLSETQNYPYDPVKDDEFLSTFNIDKEGSDCPGLELLQRMHVHHPSILSTISPELESSFSQTQATTNICDNFRMSRKHRRGGTYAIGSSGFGEFLTGCVVIRDIPRDTSPSILSQLLRDAIYATWTYRYREWHSSPIQEAWITAGFGRFDVERGIKMVTFLQVGKETQRILQAIYKNDIGRIENSVGFRFLRLTRPQEIGVNLDASQQLLQDDPSRLGPSRFWLILLGTAEVAAVSGISPRFYDQMDPTKHVPRVTTVSDIFIRWLIDEERYNDSGEVIFLGYQLVVKLGTPRTGQLNVLKRAKEADAITNAFNGMVSKLTLDAVYQGQLFSLYQTCRGTDKRLPDQATLDPNIYEIAMVEANLDVLKELLGMPAQGMGWGDGKAAFNIFAQELTNDGVIYAPGRVSARKLRKDYQNIEFRYRREDGLYQFAFSPGTQTSRDRGPRGHLVLLSAPGQPLGISRLADAYHESWRWFVQDDASQVLRYITICQISQDSRKILDKIRDVIYDILAIRGHKHKKASAAYLSVVGLGETLSHHHNGVRFIALVQLVWALLMGTPEVAAVSDMLRRFPASTGQLYIYRMAIIDIDNKPAEPKIWIELERMPEIPWPQ